MHRTINLTAHPARWFFRLSLGLFGLGLCGLGLMACDAPKRKTSTGPASAPTGGPASRPASDPAATAAASQHSASQPPASQPSATAPAEAAGAAAQPVEGKAFEAVKVAGTTLTFIGTGRPAFADEPAAFHKPIRLAPWKDGSVLVADISNHAIRVVSPDGRVQTLVGGPERAGHADGPASTAKLNGPHGVAVLDDGSIAIAEASNHTVRRIFQKDGGWHVETLAGMPGQAGFVDGPADQAKLTSPHGLLKMPDGALLIADIGNARLRLLKNKTVTTVAGTGQKGHNDGPLDKGRLEHPMALALEPAGSVLIVDAANPKPRRWTPTQGLSTPDLGIKVTLPHGIHVAGGRVLTVDMGSSVLMDHPHVGHAPGVDVSWGNPGRAGDGGQLLQKPADVLVHDGRLWIADLGNNRIKHRPWPPR